MKKLIVVLAFALSIPTDPAAAQETYSVVINTAAEVAKIDLARVDFNERRCASLGQIASCTQAQACAAAPALPAGSACTIAEANAGNRRIYSNTLGGREAFVSREWVKDRSDAAVKKTAEKEMQLLRAHCLVATPAQIDTVCSSFLRPAGCNICDAFKD